MALTDPYLTVAALKQRMGITDTRSDSELESVILAASRQVEEWTGRVFNQSAAGTVRYFTATLGDVIEVSDLVSVSEIAVDLGDRTYADAWESTDFDLVPYDAADRGRPYTEIRLAPLSAKSFTATPRGNRVTGVWGWPAVPSQVVQAVALQAHRLWKRNQAPFGVTGSVELGQMTAITSLDPDVRSLLAPFRAVAV